MQNVITYCDICGNEIPKWDYKQTIKYKPRKKIFDEWFEMDICKNCIDEIRRKAKKKQKQNAERWVPVNEGLPEKNEWYSCTVNLSDFHYVTMDLYFKDGKWLDNRRIYMFYCYEVYGFGKSTEKHKLDYSELLKDFDWTERVVAWMPLPAPFEPQEGEE